MRSRDGPTLGERAQRRPAPEPTAPAEPAGPATTARHCWVLDAPGHPGCYPGLLVEWRRGPADWQGRVVYALPETTGAARLVERWIPARHLRAGGVEATGHRQLTGPAPGG
jgi:hypothetical protein